ncbi:MAG: dTDP-4-dehydrorhamnose reductase [Thermodesulfovibrionales bacterium]
MVRYLITGKKGQLATEFLRRLEGDAAGFSHGELDIGNLDQTMECLQSLKPRIIINCAAYNYVDLAEANYYEAIRTNTMGVRNLAYGAKKIGAFLVHFSTDYVFDGTKGLPYTEEDKPNPLSLYGKSKYMGELSIKEELLNYLILRVSWVFGEGRQNFIYKLLTWAKEKERLQIASDEVSCPTSTTTIVEITLKALKEKLTGLYHLTNSGYASRYEWAVFILKSLGIKKEITPVSSAIFNLPAKRPNFSAMSNQRISRLLNVSIPVWQEATLERLKRL